MKPIEIEEYCKTKVVVIYKKILFGVLKQLSSLPAALTIELEHFKLYFLVDLARTPEVRGGPVDPEEKVSYQLHSLVIYTHL